MALPFTIFLPTIKHRDAVPHPPLTCGTVATLVNNIAREYPKANDCEQCGEFRARVRRTAPQRYVWLCAQHAHPDDTP